MEKTAISASSDPRVRRTRRALREALVSLILEKDFASLSIKEITGRADVAYITFFRHFDSPDQLLMEVLEEGLAELLARIEKLARQSGKADVEGEGRLIFEYIQDNADLFRILLRSQSAIHIRRTVVQNIAAIFQSTCTPLKRCNNPAAVNMAANHVATSLLALIEWWLENRMSPPPAQMGKVYKRLIIDSTVGAVTSLASGMGRA
jgi:AcrR family transcriptional regulator